MAWGPGTSAFVCSQRQDLLSRSATHSVELFLCCSKDVVRRHYGPAVGKLQREGAAAAQHANVKVLPACRHRWCTCILRVLPKTQLTDAELHELRRQLLAYVLSNASGALFHLTPPCPSECALGFYAPAELNL
jgi:hypothetical protein